MGIVDKMMEIAQKNNAWECNSPYPYKRQHASDSVAMVIKINF